MFFFFVFFGCIPIPVPRNTIVQPEIHIQVQDNQQNPIDGSQVLFISMSDPHSQLHHFVKYDTDPLGRVTIPELKELEWIYPLMLHGIPFYNFRLCTHKEGYIPVYTDIENEREENNQNIKNIVVTLQKQTEKAKTKVRTSNPCSPEYMQPLF